MLQRVLLVLCCWSASAAIAAADPHPATQVWTVAPADEYFGRFKMSVLGIANIIRDMRQRVEASPDAAASIFVGLENVEDAIHAWQRKYPADSWIPRDLLALETTYLAAPGDRARAAAARTANWLQRDFPRTGYARQAYQVLMSAPQPAPSAALPELAAPTSAP